MLQESTLLFLEQLNINNNKPWFDENKDAYTNSKNDFELLVAKVLKGLSQSEPLFEELKPKDCIFRINRDVRFSKDKSPYKNNFGAAFSKGGKKFSGAGYYLHIQPGGHSFLGGGVWMPEADVLRAIRQEIDYNFNEFQSIVNDKKFKSIYPTIEGEQLKKMPQGYTDDNPAAAYLKHKSFVTSCKIKDGEITAKNFEKIVLDRFYIMKPFIDFLNKSLD